MFPIENYSEAINLFPKLLGLVYFFAFGAFIFQIRGLIGSKGILPIATHLRLVREYYTSHAYIKVPSLFWINCSDAALLSVAFGGVIISLLLIFGVFPALMLLLAYIFYISIISTGQDFLAFGWEGALLEITVNGFFLILASPPNLLVWISINLLLFRFYVQAGAVKLQSRDPNWRNLTALAYHYQSQPIPNAVAWYIHKFPMWFHKLSTLFMFIVELAVPFGIFGSELIRLFVFLAFFGLQWMIWATGNFSFLNHLSVAFSIILVANAYFPEWYPISPMNEASDIFTNTICTTAGTILIALQLMHLWHHFYPNRSFNRILNAISQFHLANRYGIFAVMTTTRHEVIFEGSNDGINWEEYSFFHKPSEITRRPRRISPYQPRIDWQAWFLPLGSYYRHEAWFGNFLYHLLLGTPEVLALIRDNPFPESPPRFVRTVLYEYTFSSVKEKQEHGRWWNRKYVGLFTKPLTLTATKDNDR